MWGEAAARELLRRAEEATRAGVVVKGPQLWGVTVKREPHMIPGPNLLNVWALSLNKLRPYVAVA